MALAIPSMLLKQLHTNGSLRNTDAGVQFSDKNRLSDATFTGLTGLKFDGYEVPADSIFVRLPRVCMTLTCDAFLSVARFDSR